jgi:hypothetical protein
VILELKRKIIAERVKSKQEKDELKRENSELCKRIAHLGDVPRMLRITVD